jgi:tetratricopeptide (TPR) repeat protein
VLVATSPYTLLHGTEVVSEIPFLAGSFGLLALIFRARRGPPSWREVAVASALLAFLPLLRMVALAFGGALGLWALLRAERRRWLVPAAVSLGVFLLWAWRCHAIGSPSYLGAIQNKLDHGGLAAGEQLRFYLARFSQVLLPGLSPGQPVYERLFVEGAPTLNVFALEILLALVCVALAAHGAWRRKEQGGALALLYVALTFVILAVYPPRHERLVWPLVPLVWIFVPAGLPRKRWLQLAGLGIAVLLAGWQLLASLEIARTNLQWRAEGERFYARVPPMYFADFEGAGRWIAAHAPPSARVLTRHSEVAFTSGRYQEAIRFEETAPQDWRRALARLHARYLVVPTTQFGRLFPQEALTGDLVYALVPVHRSGDVQVLEVRPNKTGTLTVVREDAALAACRAAADRFPGRADLRVRLAELMGDAGRLDEALTVLSSGGTGTAREELARGELLLRAERWQEAGDAFAAARALPEADLLERRIRRGLARAGRGGGETLQDLVEQTRFSLEVLRPGEALEAAERARALAPDHPEILFVHGTVLQRLGRFDEAEHVFSEAAQGGHPEAARKLRLLELRKGPPSLDLARALAEDGTPGAALDVLERLGGGRDPEALHLLADLYLFYGDAERAAPLYRRLGDARGLAACEELLRLPSSLRPRSSPPPA